MNTKHVVMWGGGITSWAASRRVKETHGAGDLVLLFADVKVEDEDLYRFNNDASADIGVPITVVSDGRTPAQVDVDRRWLSNSRVAQCSLELKIKPCRDWLAANADPANTVIHLGIDWSEMHRIPGQRLGYAHTIEAPCRNRKLCGSLFTPEGRLEGPGCSTLLPQGWHVEVPLCEPPYVDKQGWSDLARKVGLKPPAMYDQGFPHNNCGAWGCCRGGKAYWEHMAEVRPEVYAARAAHEQQMQEFLGNEVTMLQETVAGVTRSLPLTVLKQRIDNRNVVDPGLFDPYDWGGCGCTTALDDLAGLGDAA